MTKSRRPIPTVKNDAELENFINAVTLGKTKPEEMHIKQKVSIIYVKKSLVLESILDDALRLESAKTRKKQITYGIKVSTFLMNIKSIHIASTLVVNFFSF